jgi:DNA-binding MarR family transcriptional regulator
MPSNSVRHTSAAQSPASDPGPLDFAGLDDLLGFQARMAHVAIYRDFNASLADLQISQRHTALLWLIGANPGVSQAALGATLGMDSATMVGVIDRLEKDGRVMRKLSRVDRRRRELYLTPAGAKLLQKVKKAVVRHDQRFKTRFNERDLAALMDGLQKISGS